MCQFCAMINPDRLLRNLHELRDFGRSGNGVVRRCLTDIDIAFVDSIGRVVKIHEMKMEEPQRENENAIQYEFRLKRYPSGFTAQFAVEVAPGTLRDLGLMVGDKIEFDLEGLKARAE